MQACIFCQKLFPKHLYHQHIVDCSASNNDDIDLLDDSLEGNGGDYNHSTGVVQSKPKPRLRPFVSTHTTTSASAQFAPPTLLPNSNPTQASSTPQFPRLSTINTSSHWLDSKSTSKPPTHTFSESLSTSNLAQFRDDQQHEQDQTQQQHPLQNPSSKHPHLTKRVVHPAQVAKSTKVKPAPAPSSRIVAVDSKPPSTRELTQAALRSREIDGLLSTSSDDSEYEVHLSIQPPQKRKFKHFLADGADYDYDDDDDDDDDADDGGDDDDDLRDGQGIPTNVLNDVVSRQPSTLLRLLSTYKVALTQPGKIETISLIDSDVEDNATNAPKLNKNNTNRHRTRNNNTAPPVRNDNDDDDDEDDLFDPPLAKTTPKTSSKSTSKTSSKSTNSSSIKQPTKRQRVSNISLVSDNSVDETPDLPIPMGVQKKATKKTTSHCKGDRASAATVTITANSSKQTPIASKLHKFSTIPSLGAGHSRSSQRSRDTWESESPVLIPDSPPTTDDIHTDLASFDGMHIHPTIPHITTNSTNSSEKHTSSWVTKTATDQSSNHLSSSPTTISTLSNAITKNTVINTPSTKKTTRTTPQTRQKATHVTSHSQILADLDMHEIDHNPISTTTTSPHDDDFLCASNYNGDQSAYQPLPPDLRSSEKSFERIQDQPGSESEQPRQSPFSHIDFLQPVNRSQYYQNQINLMGDEGDFEFAPKIVQKQTKESETITLPHPTPLPPIPLQKARQAVSDRKEQPQQLAPQPLPPPQSLTTLLSPPIFPPPDLLPTLHHLINQAIDLDNPMIQKTIRLNSTFDATQISPFSPLTPNILQSYAKISHQIVSRRMFLHLEAIHALFAARASKKDEQNGLNETHTSNNEENGRNDFPSESITLPASDLAINFMKGSNTDKTFRDQLDPAGNHHTDDFQTQSSFTTLLASLQTSLTTPFQFLLHQLSNTLIDHESQHLSYFKELELNHKFALFYLAKLFYRQHQLHHMAALCHAYGQNESDLHFLSTLLAAVPLTTPTTATTTMTAATSTSTKTKQSKPLILLPKIIKHSQPLPILHSHAPTISVDSTTKFQIPNKKEKEAGKLATLESISTTFSFDQRGTAGLSNGMETGGSELLPPQLQFQKTITNLQARLQQIQTQLNNINATKSLTYNLHTKTRETSSDLIRDLLSDSDSEDSHHQTSLSALHIGPKSEPTSMVDFDDQEGGQNHSTPALIPMSTFHQLPPALRRSIFDFNISALQQPQQPDPLNQPSTQPSSTLQNQPRIHYTQDSVDDAVLSCISSIPPLVLSLLGLSLTHAHTITGNHQQLTPPSDPAQPSDHPQDQLPIIPSHEVQPRSPDHQTSNQNPSDNPPTPQLPWYHHVNTLIKQALPHSQPASSNQPSEPAGTMTTTAPAKKSQKGADKSCPSLDLLKSPPDFANYLFAKAHPNHAQNQSTLTNFASLSSPPPLSSLPSSSTSTTEQAAELRNQYRMIVGDIQILSNIRDHIKTQLDKLVASFDDTTSSTTTKMQDSDQRTTSTIDFSTHTHQNSKPGSPPAIVQTKVINTSKLPSDIALSGSITSSALNPHVPLNSSEILQPLTPFPSDSSPSPITTVNSINTDQLVIGPKNTAAHNNSRVDPFLATDSLSQVSLAPPRTPPTFINAQPRRSNGDRPNPTHNFQLSPTSSQHTNLPRLTQHHDFLDIVLDHNAQSMGQGQSLKKSDRLIQRASSQFAHFTSLSQTPISVDTRDSNFLHHTSSQRQLSHKNDGSTDGTAVNEVGEDFEFSHLDQYEDDFNQYEFDHYQDDLYTQNDQLPMGDRSETSSQSSFSQGHTDFSESEPTNFNDNNTPAIPTAPNQSSFSAPRLLQLYIESQPATRIESYLEAFDLLGTADPKLDKEMLYRFVSLSKSFYSVSSTGDVKILPPLSRFEEKDEFDSLEATTKTEQSFQPSLPHDSDSSFGLTQHSESDSNINQSQIQSQLYQSQFDTSSVLNLDDVGNTPFRGDNWLDSMDGGSDHNCDDFGDYGDYDYNPFGHEAFSNESEAINESTNYEVLHKAMVTPIRRKSIANRTTTATTTSPNSITSANSLSTRTPVSKSALQPLLLSQTQFQSSMKQIHSHYNQLQLLSTNPHTQQSPLLNNISQCLDCLITTWFHAPPQRMIYHRLALNHPVPFNQLYNLLLYYHQAHNQSMEEITSLISNYFNEVKLVQKDDEAAILTASCLGDNLSDNILLLLSKRCFNSIPICSSKNWIKLKSVVIKCLQFLQKITEIHSEFSSCSTIPCFCPAVLKSYQLSNLPHPQFKQTEQLSPSITLTEAVTKMSTVDLIDGAFIFHILAHIPVFVSATISGGKKDGVAKLDGFLKALLLLLKFSALSRPKLEAYLNNNAIIFI